MKYKSEAMEAVYEQAVAMYKIGAITEDRMHEYDKMCLKNPEVKKISTSDYSDKSTDFKHISHAAT